MITKSISIRLFALLAAALAVAVFAATLIAGIGVGSVKADAAASVPVTATAAVSTATTPTAELVSAKSPIVVKFTPAKLVKVAKRYAGTRYAFGGSSPAGFDCSGFTKFIYAKFGVDLPHSAAAQGQEGHRVSRAKAKPGDLVITSGGAHVGIWVSKGKFIDAPRPGQVVHVRKIYTNNYYIVRVESTKKSSSKA
jgi:cell wall-associated NlpC family hydrolase